MQKLKAARQMNASGDNNIMEKRVATKLISLNKWLIEIGVTSTTGWRWRRKGILRVINIYGRLYVSEEANTDFLRRASAGEFAIDIKPGKKPATQLEKNGDLPATASSTEQMKSPT